jgi:hypothetical protein
VAIALMLNGLIAAVLLSLLLRRRQTRRDE